MFARLSLRLRVFLFFLFIAVSGIVIVGLALLVGYRRMETGAEASAFLFAAILSGFGLIAVSAGVWLLFDENIAKPIERLAASMRSRAHAGGVNISLNAHQARYLGDLAPAAEAVSGQLSQSTMEAAEAVATQTARLAADKDRLTALLTEIPVAMVVVSPNHQIVLYDGQAAAVLGQVHVPRLNASIFDYLREDELLSAHAELIQTRAEVRFEARGTEGNLSFEARLKPLGGHAPGYMIVIDDTHALIPPDAARPLIYDFDLMAQEVQPEFENRPIAALTFVVFDTETTGLQPTGTRSCRLARCAWSMARSCRVK